jgi:hypothetical protein
MWSFREGSFFDATRNPLSNNLTYPSSVFIRHGLGVFQNSLYNCAIPQISPDQNTAADIQLIVERHEYFSN